MRDFCDILKAVLPEDNSMWTWNHVTDLVDSMGTWEVGENYRRLPLCGNCRLHVFEEYDYATPCPKCNVDGGPKVNPSVIVRQFLFRVDYIYLKKKIQQGTTTPTHTHTHTHIST